jgi:hypothetical protein
VIIEIVSVVKIVKCVTFIYLLSFIIVALSSEHITVTDGAYRLFTQLQTCHYTTVISTMESPIGT